MRKLLFILIALSLNVSSGFATHLMGGEITWVCQGNGYYKFQMKVYRDCLTPVYITNAGAIALTVHNHPTISSIPMFIVDSTDISPQCNGAGPTYSCATPQAGSTAVKEYILESSSFNMPGIPGPNGWIFTWTNCCRNAAINNLALNFAGPGNPTNGFTLRAKMFAYNGQNANPCFDSSPHFEERPNIIICAATPFTYNPNAYDADLDSLSYAFDQPLDFLNGAFTATNPSSIPFEVGYSLLNPLPNTAQNVNNIPITLNPVTGEMTFTSYTVGNYVQVVKVTAYKCGQKVAEIYREIQTVILSCGANFPPNVTAPFINTSSGLFTNYIDTVTAGDLVTFSLTATDNGFLPAGIAQTMTYTAQSGQFGANYTDPNSGCDNLPCATLSLPPPQSAVGSLSVNFNWQTGCEHVALNGECVTLSNVHTFTFTFRDDYCPAPSYTVVTATIVVNAISVIKSPHMRCANVLANGDVQLTWDLPLDTALTYNSYHIYSSPNFNGPYTVIDSIFNYNTTSYTHVGAGADVASKFYFVKSRSGCFGKVFSPALDTVQTIFVSIGAPTNNSYTVSWNALSSPPLTTSYPFYRVYRQIVPGAFQFLMNTPNLSIVDNFATCTAHYNYYVELSDSLPCVSTSNVALGTFVNNVAPSAPPLDSVSVDVASQLITLGWLASLDGDVSRYIIYQIINGILVPIDTVNGINNTLYTNANSNAAGGVETYGIAAIDSCGNVSTISMQHTSIFLQYVLDGCLGKASLEWTPYIGFAGILGYDIYVSKDNAPYTLAGSVSGGSLSFIYNNMTTSSYYCFYVRAKSAVGIATAASNKVCFTANVLDLADYTYMNYATVLDDFTTELKCLIDTAADIDSYVVLRKNIPGNYKDSLGTFLITTNDQFIHYYDAAARPQETAYEYKILVKDACGNLSGESNIGQTIFLSGTAVEGFINRLNWSIYQEWDGHVIKYNIYRCSDKQKHNATLVASTSALVFEYDDDVADSLEADGKSYYFIEAEEGPGNQFGFMEISHSNVIELQQQPVLYIPNAYFLDGLSNGYGPKGIFANQVESYRFLIYDRWGELLFESGSPNEKWDAFYKGTRVQQGVYVYMLEFQSISGTTINKVGTVTVF